MSFRISHFIASFSLAWIVMPGAATGQQVNALKTGDLIRVTTPSDVSVGKVASIDSVGIVFRTRGRETIPMSSVKKLEVSRGRSGRPGRTALGGVIGLVGGAVTLGTLGYMTTQCTQCDGDSGIGILMAVPGGVLGLLIGGVVGYATSPQNWQPVAIPVGASR